MNKNGLLILFCCLSISFVTLASDSEKRNKIKKVIYKWQKNGLTYYAHIKPEDIKDYTELDYKGRKLDDYNQNYDDVIIQKPKNKAKIKAKAEVKKEKNIAKINKSKVNKVKVNKVKVNKVKVNKVKVNKVKVNKVEVDKVKVNKVEVDKVKVNKVEAIKRENCKKAHKNLAILAKGDVYAKDSKGNMNLLNEKQIKDKTLQVKRDIEYFCKK